MKRLLVSRIYFTNLWHKTPKVPLKKYQRSNVGFGSNRPVLLEPLRVGVSHRFTVYLLHHDRVTCFREKKVIKFERLSGSRA